MENEYLYETAQFFFGEHRTIHITKKDSQFNNGNIKEIKPEFLILIDEKFGEIPIFFSEVSRIEPRLPKEEGR